MPESKNKAILDGLLEAMRADESQLSELRIDGGMANNNLFAQRLADLIGLPVRRPRVTETTALGAAFLAGLGTGVWTSTAAISDAWREQARFDAALSEAAADAIKARWQAAVSKA